MTEFGQIVPQGAANTARMIAIVEDPDNSLPADAVVTLKLLVATLTHIKVEKPVKSSRNGGSTTTQSAHRAA